MYQNSKLRRASITGDDYGIDPLLDKSVYALSKIVNFKLHTIKQEERGRPDYISWKNYETVDLWWVILEYNKMTSYLQLMEGITLKIPSYSDVVQILNQTTINEVSEVGKIVSI